MQYIYLTSEDVMNLHEYVLEFSGWQSWVLHQGYVESAVEHIQNDDYYPSFEEKLTHLVRSIAMNHAFSDGNKRTALASWANFILYNYDRSLADMFLHQMEEVIVQVAEWSVKKEHLQTYISWIMQGKQDNESALLNIWRDIRESI